MKFLLENNVDRASIEKAISEKFPGSYVTKWLRRSEGMQVKISTSRTEKEVQSLLAGIASKLVFLEEVAKCDNFFQTVERSKQENSVMKNWDVVLGEFGGLTKQIAELASEDKVQQLRNSVDAKIAEIEAKKQEMDSALADIESKVSSAVSEIEQKFEERIRILTEENEQLKLGVSDASDFKNRLLSALKSD